MHLPPSGSELRIFVSGVDSTPDPLSGVGVARSLRAAFPGCELIAIDQAPSSSGLNWPDFNGWMVLANFRELVATCQHLTPHDFLISCRDEEIHALAKNGWLSPRVLIPPTPCLRQTKKPARKLARLLRVQTPPSIRLPATADALNAFLQKCKGQPWKKGFFSGARRVAGKNRLRVENMGSHNRGKTKQDMLLQAHVEGRLEVIAFAAHLGRLLGCVWMHKTRVTSLGKTWSGFVTKVPPSWRARLTVLARSLKWHGGGALEFIRDSADNLWLIDANPRFPAWIHGATIGGCNLAAELIQAARGNRLPRSYIQDFAFSRAVVEMAVRPSLTSSWKYEVVD